MSHYAKLAAIALRVISIILFIYALVGLLFMASVASRVPTGMPLSTMIMPALGEIIVAVLIFVAAPKLGRFVANGLNPKAKPQ